MKAISIFAALLGGVAIGAAAGLLLAPGEGKETRRRLKAQGARIADKTQPRRHGGYGRRHCRRTQTY